MNEELKLKKEYKEIFAEIHASEALAGKVKGVAKLGEPERKAAKDQVLSKKITTLKKLAMVAAAFVVLMVGSNTVLYATTGSIWVKRLVIFSNNKEYPADMRAEVRGDNLATYSGYILGEAGPTAVTIAVEEQDGEEAAMALFTDLVISGPEIVEQNGKMYFIDDNVKIDITEDAADGKAEGTYQMNDMTYQYDAQYVDEGWNLKVFEYIGEK